MKVKFFTVPNLLTLGNLLCGSYAAVVLIAYNDFPTAMLLIVAAALFDFCDGFAARLLHSASPIGVQLDSLADMVSFGLVPSLALYCMYDMAPQEAASFVARAARYLTFLVVAFSALRLAKFNIDDSQHTEFCGLPTPANALLCLSLGSAGIPRLAGGEPRGCCGAGRSDGAAAHKPHTDVCPEIQTLPLARKPTAIPVHRRERRAVGVVRFCRRTGDNHPLYSSIHTAVGNKKPQKRVLAVSAVRDGRRDILTRRADHDRT